jgi:hypothetical protein
MKDLLLEKGISLRLAVETLIETQNEIQALGQALEQECDCEYNNPF